MAVAYAVADGQYPADPRGPGARRRWPSMVIGSDERPHEPRSACLSSLEVPRAEVRICKEQDYPEHCWWRSVVRVITVVRVARVLLMIVLALLAISLVMSVGTTSTGPVEKVVLVLLIGGCVYAAARLTAAAEWLVHRLARR